MRGRQANPDFFNKARQGSSHEQAIVSSSSLTKKFQQARKEGHLNLSSVKPGLTEVPRQVFQLDAFLEEGEKFWEVEPLRSLDISFNSITSIPSDIGNLTNCHTIKARSNKITGPLPVSLFTGCTALRILDLSQNELAPTIPDEIGNLQELRDLSLNTNRLVQVPQSLFYLPNLRVLDLSHNNLQELPPGLSCTTLVSLNVSHNRLRLLPSLAALTCLESLHCASNQLQILPDLSNLSQLKTVDASQNQLTDFPLLPRRQSKLNQLILSYNRLSEIDMTTLESQTQLSELLVHNNALTVLPAELEALQALKVLDVSNNDLQDLPATIGYLPYLQIFKLEGNRIKTIRQTLLQKNCQEIKAYLRTRGPSLVRPHETEEDGLATAPHPGRATTTQSPPVKGMSLSHGMEQVSSAKMAPASSSLAAASAAASAAHARQKLVNNLTFRLRDINGGVLDLSKLQLQESLFEEILEILSPYPSVHSVKTLNLQHNALQTLPFAFLLSMDNLFTDLKTLTLAHNQLSFTTYVPVHDDILCQTWPQITGLDVGYNKLSAAAVDALLTCNDLQTSRFPTLTELVLEHNPLKAVPALLAMQQEAFLNHADQRMKRLAHPVLRRLQLNGCQLKYLTDAELNFDVYAFLQHLDVSENQLSVLPASIARAEKLQFLSIENNEFREIPSVLGVLPALQTLLIQGNPQRQIRSHVIQQGSVKIIQYLREKHLPSSQDTANNATHSLNINHHRNGNVTTSDVHASNQPSQEILSARSSSAASTSRLPRPTAAKDHYNNDTSYLHHHQQDRTAVRQPRVPEPDEDPYTSYRSEAHHQTRLPQYHSDQRQHQHLTRHNTDTSSIQPPARSQSASLSHAQQQPTISNPTTAGTGSGPATTSLAQAMRLRQECTTSHPVVSAGRTQQQGHATLATNTQPVERSSSSSLISARVKTRALPSSTSSQQQPKYSSGGGRSDPSSYW